MTTTPPGITISRDGTVLELVLDRPDVMNAVNAEMVETMADAVAAAADDGTRVIVLRGTGRAFSSGADLGAATGGDVSPALLDAANRFVLAVTASPVPVVSVAHGPVAGIGVSLALAADLPIASAEAYFMLAFTRIGLMPDGGATALVAAGVGRAAALRMALLAEKLPAARALELGMIASVVAPEQLDAEVERVVGILVSGPAGALARTKHAVNAAALGALESALALEREGQVELLETADFAEGVAAFRERREPHFGA